MSGYRGHRGRGDASRGRGGGWSASRGSGRGRGGSNGPTYNQHPSLRSNPVSAGPHPPATMHPQQPGWGYQAPPYGYQAPQMAYGVATPQSALLAATTLALNQSRPRFGQPAMASTPQPYMGPGAMLGVLPNQHRPASAQYPVPPRDHTRPYTPDGPSWSDTRFTSEGYTLSELAPQTWSTTEVGDELDDDRPIRKRARFEGPVVSEERWVR